MNRKMILYATLSILLLLSSSCIQHDLDRNPHSYTLENKNDNYAMQVCIRAMNKAQVDNRVYTSFTQEYIYRTCLYSIESLNSKEERRFFKKTT